MADAQAPVGRASEVERAVAALGRGANVLVHGRPGIGKSTVLACLHRLLLEDGHRAVWVPAGTTKSLLLILAQQVHELRGLQVPPSLLPPRALNRARREGTLPWRDLARTMRRLPVSEASDIVASSLEGGGFVVFIESLEVPPSQATFFAMVIDRSQTVAGMDDNNRRVRIQRLLWRFQEQIELKPLPLAASERIVEQQLAGDTVRFPDLLTRARFVRHVARESAGVPAAITGMVRAAGQEDEITPAMVRAWTHDAGLRYADMTPIVFLAIVVFGAMRYVGRGFGEVDLYVLSGVLTALLVGVRFFMWKARNRQ